MPAYPKPQKHLKERKPFGRAWVPAPKMRDSEPKPLPVAQGVRGTYAGGVRGIALAKVEKLKGGKDEQQHKTALAALGCMACIRVYGVHGAGPVELHHKRSGGWGKGDYRTLIPLCVAHHRGPKGVHGLGTKGFAKHYGFDQQDLLDDALALLANRPHRAE